ncbi:multidrug transporter [Vibrio metschnikovii]|uniref:MATE family Na+-driven efflux transporter n=1 Tax=Vibrio TaxID=662 RepID=UPI0012AE3180|nr:MULTISPECIES: MATE family Na+-driven efflux transporter [unclassified Vibrio]EKO3570529.1 multidrug transporter [Vibrio metschnikovii]EKO3642598.1 multidrug transporter [Vibrio metschnikovii]EKO3673469.1 multidrug transporter [Vibrio metschnikovii]MDQ2107471.1 multidrug transporter [Vibrio sp. 2017_1457_15]MDQ2160283.1 multidrug transporter [Vibrio sp. 2017_1457_13]
MKNHQIKTINFRLWLTLALTSLIPLIYSTTRIHFLGSIPSPWTFSIAAQVAWLNVGYEVLSEALLIPLAFILGRVIHNNEVFRERASLSLLVTLVCYFVATLMVLWLAPNFVDAMQQQAELLTQTIQYIRLESAAILLSSVYAFLFLVLVLKNERKALYGLLVVQTIMTVLCDSVFVSQLPYSLQLGVNGIALSNIVVNSLLALFALIYLSKSGITLSFKFSKGDQSQWLKEWAKIGWKSGLESLVRNTAFIIMILQLINQVQQAGTFWVANQFIWGWLLLPVLTLGQLVKQDAATNNGLTSERVNGYLWITLGIIAVWILTAPLWNSFIANVMGIENPESITSLVWLMVGFYVIFSLNNVIDSYFYGIGRTDLMLYQSLIVNTLFYGCAFVLYQIGIFVPTLERIAIMFGLGITADALITWVLYLALRSKMSMNQQPVSH